MEVTENIPKNVDKLLKQRHVGHTDNLERFALSPRQKDILKLMKRMVSLLI